MKTVMAARSMSLWCSPPNATVEKHEVAFAERHRRTCIFWRRAIRSSAPTYTLLRFYILMLGDIEACSTSAQGVWLEVVALPRQRREALRRRSSE